MSTFSFKKSDAGDKRFDGSMDGDFTPIPSQWYPAIISKQDDIKPTNDGAGTYLPVVWDIIGKLHAGRKLFFNIGRSGSEGFVNMGNAALGSILDALNMEGFQTFQQVMNKPMAILVKYIAPVYEADGVTIKHKGKNEIKGIMPFAQLEKLRNEYAEKHPDGDAAPAKRAPAKVEAATIPDNAGWDEPAAPAAQEAAAAPAQFQEQPWEKEEAAAPQTTAQAAQVESKVVTNVAAPTPEVAAPVVAASTKEAWEENGWLQHPKSPAHVYKDGVAKTKAEVNAMYAVPEAPAVPDLDLPPVDDAADGVPPWADETAQ